MEAWTVVPLLLLAPILFLPGSLGIPLKLHLYGMQHLHFPPVYRHGVRGVFIWRKTLPSHVAALAQSGNCSGTEASIPMGLSVSVVLPIRNLGHKAKRPPSVLILPLFLFFFIDLALMKSGVLLCQQELVETCRTASQQWVWEEPTKLHIFSFCFVFLVFFTVGLL